jgi:hypothetical protein
LVGISLTKVFVQVQGMTEGEWLSCTDPRLMLRFLGPSINKRKLRLFACACCRRIWNQMQDRRSRVAVELAEQYADGQIKAKRLAAANWAAFYVGWGRTHQALWARAATLVALPEPRLAEMRAVSPNENPYKVDYLVWAEEISLATSRVRGGAAEAKVHCDLLRDIFGNPFSLKSHTETWLASGTSALTRLANRIYESRKFEELPTLATTLVKVGCTDRDILAHCRSVGPHARGCWVLDYLLGKE